MLDRWNRLPRSLLAACLTLVLLLGGSCGTSGSGGSVSGNLVGGVLPPRPIWYALAPTSDPLVPIAGACAVQEGAEPLPRSVDLRRDGIIPPVQNQRWNSCVAWTFAYYMLTAVEARRQLQGDPLREASAAVDITDPRNWFSPDFLYSQRDTLAERVQTAPDEPLCFEADRDAEGLFELGCMRPEKALRLLLERGACRWDWMCRNTATASYGSCEPRDVLAGDGDLPDVLEADNHRSRRAWQPCSPGAEWYKPDCYVRFGSLDKPGNLPLLELRSWLSDQGTPIGMVVQMRQGWMTYAGENQRDVVVEECFPCDVIERRGVCLDAGGTDLGSQHMMTIIGYDDDFPSVEQYPGLAPEKRGSFLVVNQFGPKWGDAGMMWIPYSELRRIWVAGYGIVGADPGWKLRADGVARTACDAFGGGCLNTGEPCAQDDLDGSWPNLGVDERADDVPQTLGGGGQPVRNPAARRLTDGGAIFDGLGGDDTGDWFWFEVVAPDTAVEISLSKGGFEEDIGLKLTDANQRILASSVNPGSFGESVSRVICDPGIYYAKAFLYSPEVTATYAIGLAFSTPEGDDDVCAATPIALGDGALLPPLSSPFFFLGKPGIGGQATSTLGTFDEISRKQDLCDWYAVNLPPGEHVEITLAGSELIGYDAWRGASPDGAEFVGRGRRPLDRWQHAYLGLAPRPGAQLFIRVFLRDGAIPPEGLPYTLDVRTRALEASDDHPGRARRLVFAEHPASAGSWLGTIEGTVDAADPIDFHRVIAPSNSTVRVTLATLGPLCVSSRVSPIGWEAWACRRDNGNPAFEIPVGPTTGCAEIVLSVSPEDAWRLPEHVMGGAYTLTVEILLPEGPANPSVDDPPAQPTKAIGVGDSLQDVVGGGQPVHWYLVGRLRPDQRYVLWAQGACEDVTVDLIAQGAPNPVPFEEQPAAGRQVRRIYAPVGDETLWIRVLSPSGRATPYTLRFLELARDPQAVAEQGQDDRPERARTTLDFGGTAQEVVNVDDHRDYWRVDVPGAAGTAVPVRVDLRLPDASEGMRLSVWDARGRLLGTQIGGFGLNPRIDVQVDGGTRLLVLVDIVDRGGADDEYTLSVAPGP